MVGYRDTIIQFTEMPPDTYLQGGVAQVTWRVVRRWVSQDLDTSAGGEGEPIQGPSSIAAVFLDIGNQAVAMWLPEKKETGCVQQSSSVCTNS